MTRRLTALSALVATPLFFALAEAAWAAKSRLPSSHEALEAGRWGFVIAAAALVFGLPVLLFAVGCVVWVVASVLSILKFIVTWIGTGFKKPTPIKAGPSPWPPLLLSDLLHGLVVGKDKRLSTSKTVAAVWTYAVASALLSLVVAKWMGHGQALHNQDVNGLQSQYGLLLGGPLGAAILAKGIVSSQTASGSASKIPPAKGPHLNQLVSNDQDETDLGDLQYLLFNVVGLTFFFGEFLRGPASGLPTLPDLLVGLTSVSAVGYVGKKTLATGPPKITEVAPLKGKPGDTVRISGTDLVENDEQPDEIRFGHRPCTATLLVMEHGLVLETKVPSEATPGKVDVTVKTASGKHAKWAKKFEVLSAAERGPPRP